MKLYFDVDANGPLEAFVAEARRHPVSSGSWMSSDSGPLAAVVGRIVPHADWSDYAAKNDEG